MREEHTQHTLSISETAKQLGVSAHYLRLAERLQVVPPARRTSGGHRFYTLEDIEWLRRLGVGERKQRLGSGS